MWTVKIERAKQNMNELQTEISSFISTHPYSIRTKRNLQTRQLIYYVSEAKDVPQKIALISGDVIQNLRSALDYLAYDLFCNETKGNLPGRHIYFPIEKDKDTYEKEKNRKTDGISIKAKLLIDEVKPYRGGNEILWRIHELNNIDKHRLLITVGSAFRSVDIGAHMHATMKKSVPDQNIPSIHFFVKPANNLFPLKQGHELFIDGPDAVEIPEMQFKFDIVLNEIGILEGEALTEVLHSMIEEVEKLIPTFKI